MTFISEPAKRRPPRRSSLPNVVQNLLCEWTQGEPRPAKAGTEDRASTRIARLSTTRRRQADSMPRPRQQVSWRRRSHDGRRPRRSHGSRRHAQSLRPRMQHLLAIVAHRVAVAADFVGDAEINAELRAPAPAHAREPRGGRTGFEGPGIAARPGCRCGHRNPARGRP